MRPFLHTLIYGLFASFAVQGQTFQVVGTDTINRIDEQGRRYGKWVVFGSSRPGGCYGPDQKVEEGRYADNRKTGIWFEYYCNQRVKARVTFANGRPHGPVKLFHENGKISEEGVWQNNRWVGNYRLYYENGQVQHAFVFNESGRREGEQKYYFENGQLAIEGNFENGKESGLIREYHENGDLKAEKMYSDGAVDVQSIKLYEPRKPLKENTHSSEKGPVVKVAADERPNEAALPPGKKLPAVLNGKYTLYNRNRQVTKDGLFSNNRFMEGEAYFYDENGILERIAVYKDGVYVGDAQVQE